MNGWLKQAITDSALKERSVWYHGTGGKNLRSILAQGLIPDPKVRSWADDPDANFNSASRASLGGIYLTRNLMTARSAAQRASGKDSSSLIVVVEAQPRSLVADEDDITCVGIAQPFMGEWLAIEAFMARELKSNSQYVSESRQAYVEKVMQNIKTRRLPDMNPGLEARVKQLLTTGWDVALDRQAAHAYLNDKYEWRNVFWRNVSEDLKQRISDAEQKLVDAGATKEDAYDKVMQQVVPKRPDRNEAEARFMQYSDALTKTLKDIARPAKSTKGFNDTARSLGAIGFSGSNRITCVVEYVYDRKKYGDYHDRVRLVYGKMPEDLLVQWERNVGEMVMVDDWSEPERGTPTTPEEFEPEGKVASVKVAGNAVSELASTLIRQVWALPYASKANKYDGEEVWLLANNDEKIMELLPTDEDALSLVEEEVKRQLLRMEEGVFKRRRNKMGDEFDHIRAMIRGKTWAQAKRAIFGMSPGGGTDDEVEDALAEETFSRLYGTTKAAGYANVDMLTTRSPYRGKDGERYLKRLSEVRNHGDVHGLEDENINKYNETNFMRREFGYAQVVPPDKVEVYRGVPRADAKLRPGDFVTTNRSYARFYMRGKMAAIIRETVNSDDLLVMRLDDPDASEFVYFPRSAMAAPMQTSMDVAAPITLRKLWEEVNGAPS